MFTPKFRIPVQNNIFDGYSGVMPDVISIQNWLNNRSYANKNELLNTLIEINRIQCMPDIRMSIMAILNAEIQKELSRLIKKTRMIVFPLNKESVRLMDTLQQLLLETSVAYQIILHDILSSEESINQYMGSLIPESLFLAFFYLSRLLVERFQFYLSEPTFVWQELNQLYLFAEQVGAQDVVIRNDMSIKESYLQIAILRILNPYRLMRMEARKIYYLMKDWVAHCEIIAYSQLRPDHHYVVNLLSDISPHYFNEKQDAKKFTPGEFEGRIVNMDKLRSFLDKQVAEIKQQMNNNACSYQLRIHNEMLQRIDNKTDFHQERSEERIFAEDQIKLVSGLRACHHFISNKKPFQPQEELDAQLQHRYEAEWLKDKPNNNLMALLEEEKLLKKKYPLGMFHCVSPSLSESDVTRDDERDHNNLNTVISNVNLEAGQKEFTDNLEEDNWKQKNESDYGMLLMSKNDIEMPIDVGMLIAYRLNVEKVYSLAIIKWLRVNPRKGIAIGIRLISVQSRAIAIKHHMGRSAEGQFQRALLIAGENVKGKNEQRSLIVPSGIYKQGSKLDVWHNKKLTNVKITLILLATDSFEIVAFEVLDK